MENLSFWLSKNRETVELGEIKTIEGNKFYIAIIAGVDKRVYNTLDSPLAIGAKVIVSKLNSGKRLVTSKTGLSGNITISKEIYING